MQSEVLSVPTLEAGYVTHVHIRLSDNLRSIEALIAPTGPVGSDGLTDAERAEAAAAFHRTVGRTPDPTASRSERIRTLMEELPARVLRRHVD